MYAALTLPRWPLGALTPVLEVATLAMFHFREALPLRSTIALQFIRDDDARNGLTPFEQLAQDLLSGLIVAPTLHQDIQDVVVLIHRAPQVMALTIDSQEYFINGLITNDKFHIPTTLLLDSGVVEFEDGVY